MSRNRVDLKFEVRTELDQDDIENLKMCKTVDARLDVLLKIFEDDNNIWEAFYEAALEAFDAKFPEAKPSV